MTAIDTALKANEKYASLRAASGVGDVAVSCDTDAILAEDSIRPLLELAGVPDPDDILIVSVPRVAR